MGYNTSITYNGDGVTTDFAIPFTYVDTADIVVTRQNGSATWSLPSSNMVRLSAALASGDKVTIQRLTSLSTAKTIFKNATTVTGGNLNSIMTQMFNATQESADVSTTVSANFAAINSAVTSTTASATAAAASAAAAQTWNPTNYYDKTTADARYVQPTAADARYVQPTNVSFSGYVYGASTIGTIGVQMVNNQFNSGYSANSNYTLQINALGYLGGTTQFRDLQILDGKGGEIAYFTGSTKVALFDGAVYSNNSYTVNSANPTLNLNKTISGNTNNISGFTNGSIRWTLTIGNSVAETGSNAGSLFGLYRYSDTGAYLGNPLYFNRSNGQAVFESYIQTLSGGVIYPDATTQTTAYTVDAGVGGKGLTILARPASGTCASGATTAGVNTIYESSGAINMGGTLSGTWRNVGNVTASTTLSQPFQRIA